MTGYASNIIPAGFEQLYIQLRQKEQRMYSDEELLELPAVTSSHPHYKEWQLRQQSCTRLIHHLEEKHKPLHILEIGCGNGWLAKQMANLNGVKVIGTDINFTELQQAASVFKNITNLNFIYGDIENDVFEKQQFDVIVFAASIQYFSSLTGIITTALKLLKPSGEVHVLDSPFYKDAEVSAAKLRTRLHYQSLGFPEMTDHYFHHQWNELEQFNPTILYTPSSLTRYLRKNRNPFYWLCIKKT